MGIAGTDARVGTAQIEGLLQDAHRTFSDVLAVCSAFVEMDEDWGDRSCAYFFAKPADAHVVTVGVLLGGQGGNYDRREKYQDYAREKAQRLERMMDAEELVERHLTSWESRAPERDKWGGAIVVPIDGIEYLFSLSGLPEQGDEAFCLVLAERFRPGDEAVAARCAEIAERTGNPYYADLRQALIGDECCRFKD
jgi:hypothetical protein